MHACIYDNVIILFAYLDRSQCILLLYIVTKIENLVIKLEECYHVETPLSSHEILPSSLLIIILSCRKFANAAQHLMPIKLLMKLPLRLALH
jgi:hypothetical protein